MNARQLVVSQSAHIVDSEELKDVVHTCHHLKVRLVFVHDVRALWELIQQWVVGILLKERVVLVGERAPHALHSYILAPLEMLYERQTVKQLTVKVPRHRSISVAVAELAYRCRVQKEAPLRQDDGMQEQ